jgi:exodeoxyribonuclease V alpha subunit
MNNGNTFVYFSDIKNNISEMIEDFGNNDETVINGEINPNADVLHEQVNFNFTDLKKFIIELYIAKQIIIDPPFLFSDFKNEDANVDVRTDANTCANADVNADIYSLDFNKRKIYLPVYYYSELRIAKELQRLLLQGVSNGRNVSGDYYDANKDKAATVHNFSEFFTEEQKNAIINALKYKISIISGGPGTGKSTIIKEICKIHKEKNIALTSLSGKAAQRLEDIIFSADEKRNNPDAADGTTYSISTIHRLLKATINRETNESYFTYNENNKLPFDLVVIDEMSMVDAVIFSQLLKALKNEAKLVLVGDVNQLPSVNPGDLLRDLINFNENIIPSTFLTKVFRQNEGGLINLNAHNLLNNKKFVTYYCSNNYNPDDKKTKKNNEFMIKYKKIYDEKETGKVYVLEDFIDFIKKVKNKRTAKQIINKDGVSHIDFSDIQILTPMRKGELGYFKLNIILQEIFNPIENINSIEDTFICNGVQFRVNDRVIQIKNNYDLDVFNGDTGAITSIDHIGKTLTVNFSKPVIYDFLDVYSNLSLAYALSIHKSQGSEFDNVIIIFHQSHYMMLKKNLLYTAITRGKKNVVIFGTFKAFSIAMHSKIEERNSGLKDRLKEIFSAN